MSNPPAETNGTPVPTDNWLKPFENTFIGLTADAVIRRVVGPLDLPEALAERPLTGLSWREFVTQAAADTAQNGLLTLWAAIGEHHVAPEHCPAAVPFKPGVIAQLRAVAGDPEISYAVQLSPSLQCNLDTAIGVHTLNASKNLLQLSQSIFRGVYGPLTDSQVKTVGNIVTLAETLDQFFNDLRIEVTAPSTQAPMPYELNTLLSFTTQEFATIRRISTHQLGLQIDLPANNRVYCYNSLRTVLKRVLRALFEGLTARTKIVIGLEPPGAQDAEHNTIHATIRYHSTKTELLAPAELHPIGLFAAERFQPTSLLQQLLTCTQAYLSPLKGRVWANAIANDSTCTTQITLELPRWRD